MSSDEAQGLPWQFGPLLKFRCSLRQLPAAREAITPAIVLSDSLCRPATFHPATHLALGGACGLRAQQKTPLIDPYRPLASILEAGAFSLGCRPPNLDCKARAPWIANIRNYK
jgi:hypothetical protein